MNKLMYQYKTRSEDSNQNYWYWITKTDQSLLQYKKGYNLDYSILMEIV